MFICFRNQHRNGIITYALLLWFSWVSPVLLCVAVICSFSLYYILPGRHLGCFQLWALRTMLNFLKYVIEFPWIRISGPWSVQSFNFTKQGQMYSTMIESSNEQYIRAPTIIPSLTSRLLPLKHFYPMCNTCIFFPLWNLGGKKKSLPCQNCNYTVLHTRSSSTHYFKCYSEWYL